MTTAATASIKIRLLHAGIFAMGPGKADLLAAIDETRSIAAAGRLLGMSYWKTRRLLDEMNGSFREPVVTTAKGGEKGGGSELTPTGREALALFRAMEAEAAAAVGPLVATFQHLLGDLTV